MKSLLVYLKDYKKETILGPLFKMLEASFELIVPLVMAAIIDQGIKEQDKGYVFAMCGVLVLLAIIGLVCSITAQYFAAKASVGFAKQAKQALFAHIQSLSFKELDEIGTATLITRMTSDMNQVQTGVNLTLRLLLRSPFVVFGAMIMAFTVDVKAALIFVVTIPLLSIVVFGVMIWCIPGYKNVQAKLDGVTAITRENLTGVRVIRAFCKEDHEREEFQVRNEALTSIQKKVGRVSALMNPVTYVIVNLAIVVLVWTGALRVEAGILTQGAVVALYNYMTQILVELVKLANLILNIMKSIASGNRVQAIMEIQSTMEDGQAAFVSTEQVPAVEFDHVGLLYHQDAEEALTDIHFKINSGETIGVIGGTGSGKSSLIHLIPRFYDATNGTVRLFGKDVKTYNLESLREDVAVVMQKAVLFKGTIAENLCWGKGDASEEELWNALDIAQASEFVKEKEGQLAFGVEQLGRNLSGGQKQRLTIARALVRQPKVLILDDSASALDLATDAALRRAIREKTEGMTVFIVSQRASSVQHADKIIVLEDGEMVGFGTHDALLASCPVYQEIYESQYRGAVRKEA